MSARDAISAVADAVGVRRVYGEPLEREGVTASPAAMLIGGGGGGSAV